MQVNIEAGQSVCMAWYCAGNHGYLEHGRDLLWLLGSLWAAHRPPKKGQPAKGQQSLEGAAHLRAQQPGSSPTSSHGTQCSQVSKE